MSDSMVIQMNNRRPAMSGTVLPPDNLQPAIDALGQAGKAWLDGRTYGKDVEPRDISLAADYERGDLK